MLCIHRDEAIIYDSQVVEGDENPQSNPHFFQITLPDTVPFHQAEDLLMDINLTRWGFHRALTNKELMIADLYYRSLRNREVESLPSRLERSTLQEAHYQEPPVRSAGECEE